MWCSFSPRGWEEGGAVVCERVAPPLWPLSHNFLVFMPPHLFVSHLSIFLYSPLHCHHASCNTEIVVHTQKKKWSCKWYLYPSKFNTAIERHLYKISLKTRFDMKYDYCKTLFASLCVNVFTYWRYDKIIQFFNYHCVHEYRVNFSGLGSVLL